jgi:SAM-dependent methyltransferase/Tfp pilus assembly protein PilF
VILGMNRHQRRQMKRQGATAVPTTQNGPTAVQRLFALALEQARAGRLSEATDLFGKILAAEPTHAESYYNLGVIALQIGHVDDAIHLSRQAVALHPGHAEAHGNLAAALAAKGQLVEAAQHGEKALQLNPRLMAGYSNLATIYMGGWDIARALAVVMRGLKVQETPQLTSLFTTCLRRASVTPDGEEFRRLVARALTEPWGRPTEIAPTGFILVKRDPRLAGMIARALKAWPNLLTANELFGADGLAMVSADPLLRALLETTRCPDIGIERLLTMARAALLDAVAAGQTDSDDTATLDFVCTLARQCFINEYVFACSEREHAQVAILRETLIATLQAGTPDLLQVAAYAAYEPLSSLPASETLLSRPLPGAVDELLTQQVREPLAQRALREGIPQLTEIDGGVSTLVQQQYEENPYPRWVTCAAKATPQSINEQLTATFPHAPYRPLGEKSTFDMLIAGCGTGQQVVDLATTTSRVRILAVDLSLASLSYAKYRTDALGLKNIEYGQADLLQLASLGRSFDIIACTGVLHHLQDPAAGWRVLLSLLRPNGIMRLGLYSELARADVVAGREFIAERGYRAIPEDIRRCRQDILALGPHSPMASLATISDFFATSDCRDLLFHVQEHRFTVPRIRDFLAQNGLQFLGFLSEHPLLREYSRTFPEDRARIDLDNWHAFEMQHPQLFRSMYQFWVQKTARA